MGSHSHGQQTEAGEREDRQGTVSAPKGPKCLLLTGAILVLNCVFLEIGTGPSDLEECEVFAGRARRGVCVCVGGFLGWCYHWMPSGPVDSASPELTCQLGLCGSILEPSLEGLSPVGWWGTWCLLGP